MFSKIIGGIFGKKKQEEQEQKEAAVVAASPESAPVESVVAATVSLEAPAVAPAEQVDVDAIFAEKAAAKGEKLDWKVSIVDLLKLLDLDSSYSARKDLAVELGIAGYEGTAEQNLQMHKIVVENIVKNGGSVPGDVIA